MPLHYEPDPRDRLCLRARGGLASGRVRQRILEIQEQLVAELRTVDDEVQQRVDRRTVLVDGLRQCRDALGGTDLRLGRREPLPGEVHATPVGTREVRGAELRSALRRVLREAGRSLTVDEIDRGLRARGVHGPSPVARFVGNALAVELRRGRVERVAWGEYVSVEEAAA